MDVRQLTIFRWFKSLLFDGDATSTTRFLFGSMLAPVCSRQWVVCFICLCLGPQLTACSPEAEEKQPEVVRHIKHMTLRAKPVNQTRIISGVIRPVVETNVAFEIGGQILQLNVSVGDRVKKGDVIAQLDPQTYQLAVRSAEGALQSARAQLADASKKFSQQSQLYKKKFTTKTNYDTSLANLESAKSQVEIEQSKVEIARRDLTKTKLLAPFAGAISDKLAEVFEEVKAGKSIVVLHSEGEYQVEVSLPETMVNEIHVGDKVDVKLSVGDGGILKGYVKEISTQAGEANAFPVKIRLSETQAGLRPGMSVEVTFAFAQELAGETFNIPLAAVTPSGKVGKQYVFVYNSQKKVVERRIVRVVNIRDNVLIISGNVKEGDVIAVAGLSFLVDQMEVRLLDAQ